MAAWGGGGGYSNYFSTGCAAQGLEPLPISKDFPPSKNGWFDVFFFFEIFANPDPFLRVFLPQKWLILQIFRNFGAMGPSFKDFFWLKWDPCLRIFCEKLTHLGGTSPYALTRDCNIRLIPGEERYETFFLIFEFS